MKYTTEIQIDLPVEEVTALFDNPDNLKYWQPGLQSFEPISGTPGQPGAKSRLKFKMRRRVIEMIETVTVRNLPVEFSGTYEAKGVLNMVTNRFVPIAENKTRYITEQEFQFSGIMKIIGVLMPGAFRKQSQQYMQYFKEFAEQVGGIA
jgi:carbon monoxide dehydrogenase subunit G